MDKDINCNFKNFEEQDMINVIYQAQEEKLDNILKNVDKKLKSKLKKMDLEIIRDDSNYKINLKEVFNKWEDNYNIKVTEYNKEFYRQGFIDGVNLLFNCLKA